MKYWLGIDTSNYTTSAAAYFEDGTMLSQKKLLPVKQGERGLRQSDAVFLHTIQLPEVAERLFAGIPPEAELAGISASVTPRDAEGSYMPCFLAGKTFAEGIAMSNRVPFCGVSHQSGHIAAALFGANKLELADKEFVAFHISGGTTEGLFVKGSGSGFAVDIAAKTLDISAGQLIDRIGVKMGFGFPAGAALDMLALAHGPVAVKPTLKDCDCCISGIENICSKMLDDGESSEKVAAYCFSYVAETLVGISKRLAESYGQVPFLYAGGVMSSSFIKGYISERIPGAIFTKPTFSADNAAGVAYLSSVLCGGDKV